MEDNKNGFYVVCPKCKKDNLIIKTKAQWIFNCPEMKMLKCTECNKKSDWTKFQVKNPIKR